MSITKYALTKYALEQSDGVAAISNYLKQATIEHFGFDRIEVIPNFVCPDEYKPKIVIPQYIECYERILSGS